MDQPKIRLVVTDLDGTLLSRDRNISAEAAALLNGLADKGILFTFITGRPPYALERFSRLVRITAPVIACNGAMTVTDGRVIPGEHAGFSIRPLMPLLEQAKNAGQTILLMSRDQEYTLSETQWVKTRKKEGRIYPVKTLEELAKQEEYFYKANIIANEKTDEFAKLSADIIKYVDCYRISLYNNTGCEITAKGINKEMALRKLCGSLGISLAQVMAIGDNENDNEMLQAAGIGVAVANAAETTKACAHYICRESNTEGVMEAVRKFT